jgi:Flp pilus assembly pilin Flp
VDVFFKALSQLLEKFCHCEHGTTAIEYALIGSIVSISILVGVTATGVAVSDSITAAKDGILGK